MPSTLGDFSTSSTLSVFFSNSFNTAKDMEKAVKSEHQPEKAVKCGYQPKFLEGDKQTNVVLHLVQMNCSTYDVEC